MRRHWTHVIDLLLFLAAFAVLVAVACRAHAATAESTVRVYHAYLEALAVPDLPDSLNNRPRHNDAPGRIPPDLFRDPWRGGAAAPAERTLDDQLAEIPELEHLKWTLENWLPYETILVFEQSHQRCPPCKAFHEGAAVELFRAGWAVRTFRVEWKRDALFVEYFDPAVTPTIVALRGGKEIGRITGNASWRQVTAMFKPPKTLVEGAPPARSPRIVAGPSTPCRHLRGAGWTWPGGTISSLRRHLTDPPHNFGEGFVASLAPNEMIAVHDNWHDANGPSGGKAMRGNRPRLRSRGGGWPVSL